MAASEGFGIGRMARRFATTVLAATTAIGAAPTTLGLTQADSPPVALAAASTPTTGWTWRAEGIEGGGSGSGGGNDSSGGGSGGDSSGGTNISGSRGGDSDSKSGSGDGAPKVDGGKSDRGEDRGNSESAGEVKDEPKRATGDENGNNATSVGEDAKKAQPGDGGNKTAIDGGPNKVNKNGEGVSAQSSGQPNPGPGSNQSGQSSDQDLPVLPGLGPDKGRQATQAGSNLSPVIRQPDPSQQLPAYDPMSSLVAKYGPSAQAQSGQAQSSQVQGGKPSPLNPTDPPGSTTEKLLKFMQPSGTDAVFGGAGGLQSLLSSQQDKTAESRGFASTAKDFAKEQMAIVNNPASTPEARVLAAQRAQLAERVAWESSKNVAQQLGPTRMLPQALRAPLTATPWSTVEKVGLAMGKEQVMPKFAPFAKQVPYAGVALTGIQGYMDVSEGKKTWQRATAEGIGSVIGGALGAVGAGAAGSIVPGAGTAVGVAIGGAGGSYLGGKLGAGIMNVTNFLAGTNY